MESISAFETSLKENSVLTKSLLSPTQLVMSQWLGAGNEKAYVGQDHWLFYRPDVEYLTTPGFLDPSRLKDRAHGATEIQPDPIKAILDFKQQLATRGIQLVVMPMSTKPMIHPEMLAGPGANGLKLQNDSFDLFKKTLESQKIPVFDPTPILTDLKFQGGPKLYLQTDTHWTPAAMHEVSLQLGAFLGRKCALTIEPPKNLVMKPESVSALGDIAEMLKLPEGQQLFQKQTVTIEKILEADGSPWKADRSSDVLLLGDSFSNIYSLEGMGWGTGAGFAEHLSYAIGRPIDKIVINAGGAFASRRDLATQLNRGIDRLAHKKVVVYEFSMRDLAQGDWKMIKLPPAPPVVVPPVVTPVKIPEPAKQLTQFSSFEVLPLTLDLTKHEKVVLSVVPPLGQIKATVLNAKGKAIRSLGKITSLGNGRDHGKWRMPWDGLGDDKKPVPVGTYTLSLEGIRPDGSNLTPVKQDVVVFSGKLDSAVKIPVITKSPVTPPTKDKGTLTTQPSKLGNPTQPAVKPAEEGLIVTGRIASRASTPKPGSVPYKDCLIALQLTDLKVTGGAIKGNNIVVYVWGMRDNKLVDDAFNVGSVVRFKLVPWAAVDSKYGGYNRQELASDDALSWEAYWGEIK